MALEIACVPLAGTAVGQESSAAATASGIPSTSGIYVVNEAANEQSTATAYASGLTSAPAYQNDVTGHAIFVPIAKILPGITTWGQFNWDWTYVDALVQIAVSHGKKFSIELEVGFQGSTTYLQSLPSGFAATCGANCAPLFDVWVTGGSGGRCTSAYVLLPWVVRVQDFWSAAASALAAHLQQTGAYGSLTLVHIPGLSIYDEEIRLPTGAPSPATTDTQACPDGRPAYPTVLNDAAASRWQSLGYSDTAVINGFKVIATAFAQAFPDRVLGLSLFNPGANGIDFPNLTNDSPGYVASQIVQEVTNLAPGRVEIQADNLDSNLAQSEVIKFASQYSDAVGWQTNKHAETGAGCNGGGPGSCDPDGSTDPYFQLLQNGVLSGGAYLEVWSNDVVNYPQSISTALPVLCRTFHSACALTTSSSSLDFGSQLIGSVSSAKSVTLSNVGSVPLALGQLAISGDFIGTGTCGTTLALGASCTVFISFRPKALGARSGALTVNDDAADGPHTVASSGVGSDLALLLSKPNRPVRSSTVNVVSGSTVQVRLRLSGQDLTSTETLSLSCHASLLDCRVSPDRAQLRPGEHLVVSVFLRATQSSESDLSADPLTVTETTAELEAQSGDARRTVLIPVALRHSEGAGNGGIPRLPAQR